MAEKDSPDAAIVGKVPSIGTYSLVEVAYPNRDDYVA